ncbi:MAG: D-alanyl-D-alanine carboxypeptidase [Saprospiraceae bacterium]|nr:D-alanyl-D-alanine carboxypeptidase [Saprospiraceae bacterium]
MSNKNNSALLLTLSIFLLTACGGSKSLFQAGQIASQFPESLTGYVLLDPETGEILEDYQGDHYFLPASNMKLFTFYTAIHILDNPLPVFEVYEQGFYTYLRGTGFPLFPFPESSWAEPGLARSLLAIDTDTLYLCLDNQKSPKYGSGWAWDDQYYGFQTERTPLSLYRNSLNVSRETPLSPLRLFPPAFDVYRDPNTDHIYRAPNENTFYLPANIDTIQKLNFQIPFQADGVTLAKLLEQRIGRPVRARNYLPLGATQTKILYSDVPLDTLYRRMLQESDNHLAEQILLMCSRKIGKSLSAEAMIEYAQENYLQFLPQSAIWVDGSGLSRYNLTTPRSLAFLLQKIYQEVDTDRLLNLLPAGGQSGTIRNWYAANPPYVYAKTGTFRNQHCLSGYIKTRKGRILVFSFMHNNFPGPSSTVKEPMERILEAIYEAY